jgi:type IV pilus assembly protein PilY1
LDQDLDTRKIYTWVRTSTRSLTHEDNHFKKDNLFYLTNTRLGVSTFEEKYDVIDFIRGHDAYDADSDLDVTETRPWILGSFLHSNPAVVNYDSDTAVIYAGANDGMLHAFDNSTGEELWAYIPPVLLPELKDLSGTGKVYYVDGAPRIWVNDANDDGDIKKTDGDKAILVCGLRRGGRYYYALDITDPLNPEIPTGWADWGWFESHEDWDATGMIGYRMTKDSGGHDHHATYPYDEMGYSFANPVFGDIKDMGTVKDVFIVGVGYDLNQDLDNPKSSDEKMGRGLYVVEVLTGNLVWKYTKAEDSAMKWSIPSDVAAVDMTDNGLIDRVYVGDMGGRVWRFDISNLNPYNWTARILMDTNSPSKGGRKIFYPPDVTQELKHEIVFFGTGDRASPNDESTVNRLYAVKDRNDNLNLGEDDLTDVTLNLLQESNDAGVKTVIRNALENDEGWYIALDGNLGEKTLAPPVVVGGAAYYTTFTPTAGADDDPCFMGDGTGRLYALNYLTGEAVHNYDTASPTIGRNDRSLTIGTAIPSGLVIALLQGNLSGFVGIRGGILKPDIGSPSPIHRVYWRDIRE